MGGRRVRRHDGVEAREHDERRHGDLVSEVRKSGHMTSGHSVET